MSIVNLDLVAAQVSEVYKWLCFVSYLCLSEDERSAGRLDDVQYILEHVVANRTRDLSESGTWWEVFTISRDQRIYASYLISAIRKNRMAANIGLNSSQMKSLPFYFSEFRGLALTLKAARDSESHRFLAAGEASFTGCYGAQVLRLFDLAAVLHKLVLSVAAANREEAERFSFRTVRPSSEEIEPCIQRISSAIAASGLIRPGVESNLEAATDDQPLESPEPSISLPDLLEEVEQLFQDALEAYRNPLQDMHGSLRQELASVRNELRSVGGQISELLSATPRASATGPQASRPVPLPVPHVRRSDISGDLETDLISLRDEIYESMHRDVPGFKHYHNILQRPIVQEIVKSGASSYAQVRSLPEFQSRIFAMSKSFALAEQEERFSTAIDNLLSRHEQTIPF